MLLPNLGLVPWILAHNLFFIIVIIVSTTINGVPWHSKRIRMSSPQTVANFMLSLEGVQSEQEEKVLLDERV
jgi:hypothetical protein